MLSATLRREGFCVTDLNLITDAWVPVLDSEGKRHRVTPAQVLQDEYVAFGYPQPDLNAACLELILCMVQTASAPQDNEEWEAWMEAGAFPGDTESRLKRLEEYFWVKGDDRPFMQDPTLDIDPKKVKPIELLDASRAPAKAVSDGKAIFARPDGDYMMNLDQAALRLFIYQSWSPIAVSVFRGSYRGHGPMTALIRYPRELRRTVIANLLPHQAEESVEWIDWRNGLTTVKDQPRIPHLGNCPGYWCSCSLWMTPRRVRLAFEEGHVVGFVNGLPKRGELPQTKPHPHSPGHLKKVKWVAESGWRCKRGYRDLLPVISGTDTSPAIKHFLDEWLPYSTTDGARVLAHGYHVQNNVDGWNETQLRLPSRPLTEDQRNHLDAVLKVAEKMLKRLYAACYDIVKDDARTRDLKPHDKDLPFDTFRDRFYGDTTQAFENLLTTSPERGDSRERRDQVTHDWWESALDSINNLLRGWASRFSDSQFLAGKVRAERRIKSLRYDEKLLNQLQLEES